MRLRGKMVYKMLQVCVWLYCVNCALSTELPTTAIGKLMTIITNLPTKMSKEKALKSCPTLWKLNSSSTGQSLGSFEEFEKLCPETKITMPSSLLCIGAIQISNYLCSASERLVKSNTTMEVPAFNNSLYEDNAELLCEELTKEELLKNSESMWNKHSGNVQPSELPHVTNILKDLLGTVNCTATCTKSNRICQIVLHGLKTIMSWAPLFEAKPSDTNNDSTPTVSNTTTKSPEAVTILPTATNAKTNSSKPSVTQASDNSEAVEKPKTQVTVTTTNSVDINENEITVDPIAGRDDVSFDQDTSKELGKPQINVDGIEYVDDNQADEDLNDVPTKIASVTQPRLKLEKSEQKTTYFDEPEDTHFIFYFIVFVIVTAGCYIAYHRRARILALIVEGRGSRRRPVSRSNSTGYKRLDNNLEEVITSSRSVKNPHVIY